MSDEKHVDESWKDNIANEKDQLIGGCAEGCEDGCSCGHGEVDGEEPELQVNFLNYVMSMGYQAMIFLGAVPNPVTGQSERNLRQAKFLIDTLALLKEKTRGNLTPEEENLLTVSLSDLQMQFVDLVKKGQ
ncbi:MAG: DUF1844 domain-containing protein [Candidatus Omnitrophica bacterium]|nr:DUF1844 domain-containing protein [Candidatus Omnitrophota bacterium]